MPDREKVIKGLECMTDIDPHRLTADCRKAGCAYVGTDCELRLMEDALALLKEQDTVEHALEVLKAHGWKDGGEAVKPIIERSYTGFWPLCGVCEGALTAQGKYCPHCGRAVKWDA